jgi:pimeloyl-ACP methyl ester carboxylesterase
MNCPIYLIPGLGADQGNYPAPWDELPNCTCLSWPEYHGKASIAEVARFVAEAWQLPPDAILVGTSFGGLVACELSKVLPVHAVVLVASTTSRDAFIVADKIKRLTRILPLRLVQWLLRCSQPLQEKIWGRKPTPVVRAILDSIQMFCGCQASFYRKMFQAISTWKGLPDLPPRLVRIHGIRDQQILPPPNADLYLDGGHLIVMTHAHECVRFIQSWLERDQEQSH